MTEPSVTCGMVTAALAAVGEHDVSLMAYRRVEVQKMIVAALRAAPAQGEPVAWRASSDNKFANGLITDDPDVVAVWRDHPSIAIQPLYAALPSSPAPVSASEAISPADLAEVLANVRAGIGKLADRGIGIPLELHRACQALSHMVKDSR